MSILARAQITIVVINDGPTGPTGKRMLTGMVHYQLSNASAPDKPSATAFNLATREFTGLTANWAIDSPVYASGNANKYWYCTYTVEESASGSGTGTPIFGTVKQAIGFSGLVTFTGDQSVSDGTKTLSFGASGATKIDGGNIETGTVSADRIDVDNLVAKQVVIGKIQDVAGPLASTAKSEAISAAAEDASTKATAAETEAKAYADTQLGNFATTVTGSLSDLQSQIDGNITTWFYAYVPTTANAPASGWTTTALKNQHLGDLFYNTATGFCYRYQIVSSAYSWQRITDSDVTKALADAADAKDTADSKRRVFVATPVTPYDIGDLWLKSGDLYKCKVTRATGSYVASDWEKGVKYTDDTAANAAAAAAAAAQSAADDAQDDADAANTLLTNIASDSKLTASEKQAAQKEWDIIQAEKTKNDTQADLYSVSKTVYTNAYNALNSYLSTLLSNLTTTSNITGSEFRGKFKDYYNARTDLLNAISNAAKAAAEATAAALDDAIQVGGRNLLRETINYSDWYWDADENIIKTLGEVDVFGGNNAIKITPIPGYTDYYFGTRGNLPPNLGTITISMYLKANQACTIPIKVGENLYSKVVTLNTSWAKVVYTVASPPTYNIHIGGWSSWSNSGVIIWLCYPKIEKGNKATDWTPAPEDVQAEIDAAAAAAAAAQSAADDAQDDADAANALLTNIASDSKLTASEKQAAQKEWDIIQAEKTKNDTQADLYSVSKTAYTNAYNALSSYLPTLLSNLTTTSNITGSEFRGKFKDYYNARTDLLNAISNAAKAAAEATAAALDDAIQVGGRNLLKDTKAEVRNTNYPLKNYYLGSVKPQEGEQVTIMFRGALGTGKVYFALYNSGGSVNMGTIDNTDKGADGIYRKTFNWIISTASNTHLSLYPISSSVTAESWVAEMMLVIGNKVAYYSEAPEDVQAEIDAADAAAAAAQSTANAASTAASNAQTSANTANNLLSDIANDNKFTPSEKQETKKEWDAIVSEKTKNDSQADTFGVSKTAYGTAYTALSNYITPLLSSLTTTSDITGTTFRSTFKTYYDARTDLLNAIAAKARTLANTAQTTADNAATAAADTVTTAASDATTKMNAAKDAIAQKAGYTDYDEMVAKAPLTVNGLLNSNIINTDQIFADKLLAFSAFINNLTVRKLLTPVDSINARVEIKEPTTADPYARINITGSDIDSVWNTYLKMYVESIAESGLESPSAAFEIITNWGTANRRIVRVVTDGLASKMLWNVNNPAASGGRTGTYNYEGITIEERPSGGDYAAKIKLLYNLTTSIVDFILDGLPTSNPGGSVTVWKDSKGFLRIGAAVAYTAADVGAVPTTRKVNNKSLSADISLTAADVGAAAASHTHEYVPTSRTVNSKALSANITLSASDVGAAASSHSHTPASIGALPDTTIQYFTQAQWNALTQAQKDAVPLALVEE